MPWELFANDPIHHPGDVTSYSHIETELVDHHRKMNIVSGIAVPAFEMNSDETIARGVCTVHLGVFMVGLEQATCEVGLAAIWNGKSSFVFAIDDTRVDLDETGELRLFAALGLNGENSALGRFGFQVVAIGPNASTSVSGEVRWSRDVNDRTQRSADDVRRTYIVEAFQVEMVTPNDPAGFGFERLIPLGRTAFPIGTIRQEGDDFVVPYEMKQLPLGLPLRLSVQPSTEFGAVITPQISGPSTVRLNPSHLTENDVSFRIVKRTGPS